MLKDGFNILFTSCGRRVSLAESFRQAGQKGGFKVTVNGADMRGEDCAAGQACDKAFRVSPVYADSYLDELLEIVRAENINLLIPTIDLDLLLLAENRARFEDAGCTVFVPNLPAVQIARDKRKTLDFLRSAGLNCPKIFTLDQAALSNDNEFFIKPWDGSASTNTVLAAGREELLFYAKKIPNSIIQEYISGIEYTCDIFTSQDNEVRCVVPRRRISVRAGEVSIGQTACDEEIISQCRILAATLRPGQSVLTVQLIKTPEGQMYFIEINARFGGGAPLTFRAGADYPLWIMQELSDGRSEACQSFQEGLKMYRYDSEIWV
ncbi:carbamoyl phosphate synthase-like protein [Sedimentisphaera cyanobacteriorum]|uniref:Carbamoyl phosphate synthase-like protein n=1 Tax=Sedimentisphaera cyanobacteriorum TaxID=1940790 RepID=A0A1Q2HNN6_9BACT|nr:ATP-grasp domain-containing protein [Sedimentisphaera cyanobacteriorum]AQQ09062.1 carbamoyl phosphate synthase-like protein [Sedimentisphaera cyanobacteriorum]